MTVHECKKIKFELSNEVICGSSIFRNIDKERVVNFYLEKVLKMEQIKYNHEIFQFLFINHNYCSYVEEFRFKNTLNAYRNVKFSHCKEVLKMNKNFRNFYGEEVGYYFSWISHFITWLIIPTVIGLCLSLFRFSEYLFGTVIVPTFYIDTAFTCIIIIWGNLYVQSWEGYQKFYNYLWGMEDYNLEELNSEMNEASTNNMMFMDIMIPQRQGFMSLIKKVAVILIITLMILLSVFSNLVVFHFQDILMYDDISNPLSVNRFYLILAPVLIFLIREILSHYFFYICHFLTRWEIHTNKNEYRKYFAIKSMVFEFFNYYFSLYYIAFIKNKRCVCAYNDCYYQLGTQLFIIQLTGIIYDFASLVKVLYFEHNNKRRIEKDIAEIERQQEVERAKSGKATNLYAPTKSMKMEKEDKISKMQYFTRTPYEDENIDKEYLEVVMNFGYVIQYGAAAPVCFLFALIHAFISRLVDAIKFGSLQYVHIIRKKLNMIFNIIRWLTRDWHIQTSAYIIYFYRTNYKYFNQLIHLRISFKFK